MDNFIKLIRALIRPFLTAFGWAYVLDMYSRGMEVPIELLGIITAMMGWWFYDRSKLHTTEVNNKKSGGS